MVRSILFPKPLNMKFYADAIKFVLVLAVLGKFGPLLLGIQEHTVVSCGNSPCAKEGRPHDPHDFFYSPILGNLIG